MRVVPLSDALGVELLDFDVKRPCALAEQSELRLLLCKYHLLAVRGQNMDEEDQNRFVGYFGPLHVLKRGGTAAYVSNKGDDGQLRTGTTRLLWHSDGAYGPRPGIATSLWAQEFASGSSPTMFANAVRALDQLPTGLRAHVENLTAVQLRDTHVERSDHRMRKEDVLPDAAPGRFIWYERPVVLEAPHSGLMSLYVSELNTSHIIGLPPDESEALIQELFSRLYATENVYSHDWQANDLIIWDNMALQHCRPAEMGSTTRHLRRQSLDGWFSDNGAVLDWPETVVPYAVLT